MRGAAIFVCLLVVGAGRPAGAAVWEVALEAGRASSGYNDIRIPGDTGTKISFSEELDTDPTAFARARLSGRFGERHTVSALVAPLTLEASGSVDRPVLFEGVEFPAGAPLEGRYRFDSYRLTYRYEFDRSGNLRMGAGVTAKVRDAAIRLRGDGRSAEKKNTGLVPLLSFRAEWRVASPVRLVFDADALAAPQGRAEDLLAAVAFDIDSHLAVSAGYRLLEGGADNDEVYTFTWIDYWVAGLSYRF